MYFSFIILNKLKMKKILFWGYNTPPTAFLILVLMLLGSLSNFVKAQSPAVGFLANAGQMMNTNGTANPNLLFSGQVGNAKVYITKTNMSLVFFQSAPDSTKKDSIYRMDIAFVNSNAAVTVAGQNMFTSYNNYFIGTLERRDVKEYGKITMTNLWPNISLELVQTENEFKLNYLLAVGANPNNIQLQFNNAKTYNYISGDLNFTAPFGNALTMTKFVWTAPSGQSVTPAPSVTGSFNATTKIFSVVATNYQSGTASSIAQNIPTIPVGPIGGSFAILKWGTYYGGTAKDVVKDIYLSSTNFMYVLGETYSIDFPVLNPLPDPSGGGSDLYVVKFKPNRDRVFSTYIGSPDGYEIAGGIAVNSKDEIYLTGNTSSSKYPLQPGSFTYNGVHKIAPSSEVFDDDRDGVITKLRPDGQYKLWSSYFATKSFDYANDIAIDQQDNVYMVGNAGFGYFTLGDLPIKNLNGGFNQSYNSCNSFATEAYIAKFNKFDTLVWSTYYGGCGYDNLNSCVVDKQNNFLVYGTSSSSGTVGACNTTSPIQVCGVTGSYQQNRAGGSDPCIAKFNPAGQITWATFYGGTGDDVSGGSASTFKTDTLGDIYITGLASSGFPLTAAGTNQTVFGGGGDAFVVRFSSTGVRKWASYLGGSSSDRGTSISLLKNGDFLVAGITNSTNFPYQSSLGFFNDNSFNGITDCFLTQYSATNTRLSSSYLGGSQQDESPVINTSGFLMAYGLSTKSNPYYVRALSGAYNDPSYNGSGDGFIMSMSLDPDPCNVYPIGCRTSGIQENKLNNLFSVYPNPTSDNLTINIKSELVGNKTLSVYDSFGKVIFEQVVSNQQEFINVDLSKHSKGLYFVKIVTENSFYTEKIILN